MTPPERTAAAWPQVSRATFLRTRGADPRDIQVVTAFARAHGLTVVATHAARRCVRLRGTVAAVNAALRIELHDHEGPKGGRYRTHAGSVFLPQSLRGVVCCVMGLDTRPVPARHYAPAASATADPPGTVGLTPGQVATLYAFPAGDGAGQTIGIYEMVTGAGPPGYAVADVEATLKAFGGGLALPALVDVSVDGTKNSGKSDAETLLDVTVAGAIAQGAKLAVYFTGESTASLTQALQRMIHPDAGDPEPNVISISYGWGLDDGSAGNLTAPEVAAIDELFQDAASLGITVLVSSGDSGAMVESSTSAQASFPATDPWVLACGGTTLGDISGPAFDEYVWNDGSGGSAGATGGGISPHFALPDYQKAFAIPQDIVTGRQGRGLPDVAGNASPNSGYTQVIAGQRAGRTGGTSAVAPLYAGLMARINGNLGRSVGFINPQLYNFAGTVCRDVVGPPGPADNSYDGVKGYPASAGWNACTGLGSFKGTALQNALGAAGSGRKSGSGGRKAKPMRAPKAIASAALARSAGAHH